MTEKILKFNTSRTYFYMLASLVGITIFAYVYCVNGAVMSVVTRNTMEKQISSLQSSVSDAEFRYMSLKNNITLDMAYSMGFKDAVRTKFISEAPTKTLSFKNEI